MEPVHERDRGQCVPNGPFSDDARRIATEDVLILAERLRHRALTVSHLPVILERAGEHTSEIMSSLPDIRERTAAVSDALPGDDDS
jgi:hypothetical protein